MAVEIGDKAPDFELKDHRGETVTLASVLGDRPVAIVFVPFAFSGICEGELCQIRDDYSRYEEAGMQVLAISCDNRFALAKWAELNDYQFTLLADYWPHGEVARAYGVFDDQAGCAVRATFVVDKDGTVVDTFATGSLGEARDPERYGEALARI